MQKLEEEEATRKWKESQRHDLLQHLPSSFIIVSFAIPKKEREI
jgi:hypothetical protein